MYVGAPVRWNNEIVGTGRVGKPVQSFGQFVEDARARRCTSACSRRWRAAAGVIVSVWLVRPFGLIADYVRYVRAQRRISLPRLGRRALGVIGAAYDEMRDALAGRNYVADYVQTLTHEVKSPLSAIRGAAELLQEPGMPPAERQKFLGNITRETQRIQEMVDRMMELTALETRRSLEHVESIALKPLLEEAVAAQPAPALRARCACGWTRRDDAWSKATLPAAPRGEQPAGQRHRLLARRRRGARDAGAHRRSAVIACSDQGPGIPEYAQDKVFEKFYSLARPHTRARRAPAWACPSCARSRRCTMGASSWSADIVKAFDLGVRPASLRITPATPRAWISKAWRTSKVAAGNSWVASGSATGSLLTRDTGSGTRDISAAKLSSWLAIFSSVASSRCQICWRRSASSSPRQRR
jgi:signal transduction histidine kinase